MHTTLPGGKKKAAKEYRSAMKDKDNHGGLHVPHASQLNSEDFKVAQGFFAELLKAPSGASETKTARLDREIVATHGLLTSYSGDAPDFHLYDKRFKPARQILSGALRKLHPKENVVRVSWLARGLVLAKFTMLAAAAERLRSTKGKGSGNEKRQPGEGVVGWAHICAYIDTLGIASENHLTWLKEALGKPPVEKAAKSTKSTSAGQPKLVEEGEGVTRRGPLTRKEALLETLVDKWHNSDSSITSIQDDARALQAHAAKILTDGCDNTNQPTLIGKIATKHLSLTFRRYVAAALSSLKNETYLQFDSLFKMSVWRDFMETASGCFAISHLTKRELGKNRGFSTTQEGIGLLSELNELGIFKLKTHVRVFVVPSLDLSNEAREVIEAHAGFARAWRKRTDLPAEVRSQYGFTIKLVTQEVVDSNKEHLEDLPHDFVLFDDGKRKGACAYFNSGECPIRRQGKRWRPLLSWYTCHEETLKKLHAFQTEIKARWIDYTPEA